MSEATGMTVTAREVIGITAFGYRIRRPVPKLEAVAQCIDEKKAAAASLPAYKNEVKKYQTIEAFRKFYATIPESARQYKLVSVGPKRLLGMLK